MNCKQTESRLSNYIDNILSAHEAWEVERHLAKCSACAKLQNELKRTVDAIGALPAFELSPEFAANLHDRLAGADQESTRAIWRGRIRELLRPRLIPAWCACAVVAALLVIGHLPRTSNTGAVPKSSSVAKIVQTAKMQNVALSASDPLDDIAVANLSAQTQDENSSETDANAF